MYTWQTRQSLLTPHVWSAHNSSLGAQQGVLWGSYAKQHMMSRNHPIELLGRTKKIDVGGNWLSCKIHLETAPGVPGAGTPVELERLIGSTDLNKYTGHLYPSDEIKQIFEKVVTNNTTDQAYVKAQCPVITSDANLDVLGATAISRVLPTNPLSDGAAAIAEILREGLPHAPGTNGNIGSEYLNVEFGILPTISAVQDAREAIDRAKDVLEQYERDSGRLIRRRYRFPPTESTTTVVQTGRVPSTSGGAAGGIVQAGTRTTRTITKDQVWFSGAFTYYLAKSGIARKLQELDRVHGLVPGADTLWELTPWSWLADYFTNMGDVMKNYNAFHNDGLVMPYAYVMRKSSIIREITWQGNVYVNNSLKNISVSTRIVAETKQRKQAHPYGFGMTDEGLSTRRKLILAALGISRL